MKPSSLRRTLFGKLATLWIGFGWLGVTACGAAETAETTSTLTSEEALGSLEEPITGGWTALSLGNGWSATIGSSPAVGIVNGVVTFRGTIQGNPNAGDAPFTLPASFRPGAGADSVQLRVSMSGNAGGTLSFVFNNVANTYDTHLRQDGFNGPGPAAKAFTSLEGVSVDMTAVGATTLDYASNGWSDRYSYRTQGAAATVKLVNGFVRFQGFLTEGAGKPPQNMLLFNIPSQFRPGLPVYVPVSLCEGVGGSHGRLNILPNGDVVAQAQNNNTAAANCGTSLEGASYAFSFIGTSPLSLASGWVPYSARAVRVRNDGGVIRLQGAVAGGSSTLVATLPVGMRPANTIYVVADAINATRARLIIAINGNISVDPSVLSAAQGFLSLDGVSFGI